MILDPFSLIVGLLLGITLVLGVGEVLAARRVRVERARARRVTAEVRATKAPPAAAVRALRPGRARPGPRGAA